MSQVRRIQRNMRRRMGDAPNARVDAAVRVHPVIDRLVTDAELACALYRLPVDVARSRAKTLAWKERINRRLAVPESVRMAFAMGRA